MNGRIDMDTAIAMRRNGKTYMEIAKCFGVSWQAVQYRLVNCVRARKDGDWIEQVPYNGLYDFLMMHDRVSIPVLTKVVLSEASRNNVERMRRFCYGRNVHIPKKAIDRLIAYTGLTYEELFKLRGGFKEEEDA